MFHFFLRHPVQLGSWQQHETCELYVNLQASPAISRKKAATM